MVFFTGDRRKPTPTFVYVMASGDSVKIGLAEHVEPRRRTIQLCCPQEVTLLGSVLLENFAAARIVERKMHVAFSAHRTFGEWFRMDSAPALAMLAEVEQYARPAEPVQQHLPERPARSQGALKNFFENESPQMKRMRKAIESLEFEDAPALTPN